MGVILLVSMLAASRIIPVLLQPTSSAGALHPANLTVTARHPEYFEGETIELVCSTSQNRRAVGYSFFDQERKEILKVDPDHLGRGKLRLELQINSTGNYSCKYWMKINGTEQTSAQSNTISLRVNEAPAAPSLSLDPKLRGYHLGESINLVCSAPQKEKEVHEFKYYGERVSYSTVTNNGSVYRYNVSITDLGLYECAYVLHLSGRNVLSKRSKPVFINGIEAPAAPSLSLDPKLHAYRLGDSVNLVCSSPPEEKDVQEFKYYSEIAAHSVVNNNGSISRYNVNIAETTDLGLYECAYVLCLSGRNVVSKRSNPVFINGIGVRWVRMLAVGGSFFTINGIIFLISHCFC